MRRLRHSTLGALLIVAAGTALSPVAAAYAPLGLPNLGAPIAPTALALEAQLGKSEHKKLVKAIDEYYAAKAKNKGVLDAREELEEVIGKIERKAKAPVLGMVSDLELVMSRIGEKSDRVDGKGKVKTVELGRGAEATVHAPKSYKADDGPWPLVIAVPDEGQEPADLLRDDWLATAAATEAIVIAPQMAADSSKWISEVSDPDSGARAVMMCIGYASRTFSVDPNRIFVVGRGAGVAVAAETVSLFPERFAAAVGVAGDLGDTPVANFGTVPSLWIGGSSGVDGFLEALGEAGYENGRSEAAMDAADIWTWIGEQTRLANPSELVFRPRTDRSDSSFWLKFEGIDSTVEGAGVKAIADREENTVTIDAVGMTKVRIFLNDTLVDLEKPVRVIVNGVEHETEFSRSLTLMLDRIYSSGDPGRIFTATRVFDVPLTEAE